jgi:hypothetical protein
MPDFIVPFLPLFALTIALISLYLLSHEVSIRLQQLVLFLTGSEETMTLVLFLVFLPGIFVHESAHWLMARALGLKTAKFRVWPKRQGKSIGMGSVSVQPGGVWRDSLVGVAPLLAGTLLSTFIAHRIFGANGLTDAWVQGDWRSALHVLGMATQQPDSALWAYLLFAIANAMMPSSSDREPFKMVLLYVAIAAVLYLFLGLPASPLAAALDWSTPYLLQLTSALLFTILLDLAIVLILFVLVVIFTPRWAK